VGEKVKQRGSAWKQGELLEKAAKTAKACADKGQANMLQCSEI
jgi:hypothetical protein